MSIVKAAESNRTLEAFALGDDAAWSYNFGKDIYAGTVIIGVNNNSYNGIFSFRATTTSALCAAIAATGMTASTGAKTGTTGADATITVSPHTDQKLYIENRSGAARTFSVTLNAP